jgi:MFS family permease
MDRVAPVVAAPRLDGVIRRNTVLLALTLGVNSAVLQLVAAISSLTFVLVTGVKGLLGLGPAIFLTSAGLTAMPAGRLMDRVGRVPVLAVGYLLGCVGCLVTALATQTRSALLVVLGFVAIGAASGIAQLIRTAAGDMYPAERRARGISYVLVGSVFGAVLGATVYTPLFANRKLAAHALTVPWLVAAGISVVALAVIVWVRPDPRWIGERLGTLSTDDDSREQAAPLREILRRPGVLPAMLAAFSAQAVMVSVMNLSGYVVVGIHHHAQADVFPVVSAHVFGMYVLVLVVGALVDRVGRTLSLVVGLCVVAVSTFGLQWFSGVPAMAVLLFGLGIGWNIAYVAAAAQLADRTAPVERGRLFGFNDLIGALLGASLALLGGVALEAVGVISLAVGAAVLAIAPAAWIVSRSPAPASVGESA